jgi:hypothetical protein
MTGIALSCDRITQTQLHSVISVLLLHVSAVNSHLQTIKVRVEALQFYS